MEGASGAPEQARPKMNLPHPCLVLFVLVTVATGVVMVVYFAGGAWWLTEQVDYSDTGSNGGDITADSGSSDALGDVVDTNLPPRGVIGLCVIGAVFMLAACTDDR